MDAIVLLKQNHKDVEKLFRQFEKLGDGAHARKRSLVSEMVAALATHAAIEEEHFYPAVRRAVPDIEPDVLEGLEEHHIVKWTLSELQDMSAEHERFDAKVSVLIESVRHHVEEEEGEMFPQVRAALGRKTLTELGDLMVSAATVAPKRAHPRGPDTPPGNLAANAGAAGADAALGAAKKVARKVTGRR